MPMLQNLRHEVYAQGLAAGAPQLAAYVAAGFKPNAGSACRCAKRPDVVRRVAELREGADVTEAVGFLTGIAERAKEMDSAAGLNTARVAKLDALKLKRDRDAAAPAPGAAAAAARKAGGPIRYPPPHGNPALPPLLTQEEWILKHVPLEFRADVLAHHLAYLKAVPDTTVRWAEPPAPQPPKLTPPDPMGAAPDLDDD